MSKLTPEQMKAALKAKAEGKPKPFKGVPTIEQPNDYKELEEWDAPILTKEEMTACLEAKRLGKPKPIKNPPHPNKAKLRQTHFEKSMENLRKRLKNYSRMKEARDRQAGIRNELQAYEARLRELNANIARHEAGMLTALQLFNKNKHREEKRIGQLQDSRVKVLAFLAEVRTPVKKVKKVKKIPLILPPKELPKIPEIEEVIEEIKEIAVDIAVEKVEEPEKGEVAVPTCKYCGRTYKTEQWLTRHINDRHKDEKGS